MKRIIILIILAFANATTWLIIIQNVQSDDASLVFLDVGQGDSALINLPKNVQILIDGGPRNGSALKEIQNILSQGDRYIDLLVITHPQTDHFGGFLDIIGLYDVGLILGNGISGESKMYQELMHGIQDKKIPYVQINTNDVIQYSEYKFSILNPDLGFIPKDPNDGSVVVRMTHRSGFSALFTGDISSKTEEKLSKRNPNIKSTILKVSHHGSKYSSNKIFLNAINPVISVISVGKNNYGHPTKDALQRLAAISDVIRTDEKGSIMIPIPSN